LRVLDRLSTLRSRPFPQAHNIRREIQSELNRQCPRDWALLPGEATCNACRLRLGARVLVRDAKEIESQIAQGVAAFAQVLNEPSVREYLAHREGAHDLLQWKSDIALLPLLDDEVLALLDEAFKPRRRVTRALQELNARLKPCRTREEFETEFSGWLDGGENLAGDDEIELS
jgi:hypothetical protein